MKLNVKRLLPIGLSVLMPLLGITTQDVPPIGINYLQKWALSALLFYFMWHTIMALRRIGSKGGINRQSLFMAFGFLCLLVLIIYLYGLGEDNELNGLMFIRLFFSSLFFFLIQHTMFAQEKVNNLQMEKEKLQTENLRIHLKELSNQMDPHFFFNSLTTLRSMVRQNHENSEQFIVGLANLYREMLKFHEDVTLPLSKELEILESYVFIMKNRNEHALVTDFEAIDEDYRNYRVPTLALQSVVENCFKHNAMSSKTPLKIVIGTTEDGYLLVKNNLRPKLTPPESNSMGLALLKKRYELLGFPGGLVVEPSEEDFVVKLKLIHPQ